MPLRRAAPDDASAHRYGEVGSTFAKYVRGYVVAGPRD